MGRISQRKPGTSLPEHMAFASWLGYAHAFGLFPLTNGDPFILSKGRFSCRQVVSRSGQHRKYLWIDSCTKTCFQTIAHWLGAHPCYSCITAAPCTVGKGMTHTLSLFFPSVSEGRIWAGFLATGFLGGTYGQHRLTNPTGVCPS